MPYKIVTLRLTGAAPLLMHNARLADPLNEFSRAIKGVSARRTKTEADHEELAKLEFLGSLNLSGGEPCLTGEQIEAMLRDGARRSKQGKEAQAGVLCDVNSPLLYEGPREPDALWNDERFRLRASAKVGKIRVMRTRPIFRDWACEVPVEFNDGVLNHGDLVKWATVAGIEIGLGDWRPRFGRFAVEAI